MKKIRNSHMLSALLLALAGLFSLKAASQTVAVKPLAPDILPGKGLKQFDFFYAGEAKSRNMYIVRRGEVTWSYIDTTGKGEISDAILMKNGNILFAHQYGVTLINSAKQVLWHNKTPDGAETHTAQLIGKDHVIFVQNGNPAKVMVMNIKKDQLVKEFILPFKSSTHGQIRHARLTSEGTFLVAHMDLGKINEYDFNGNLLSSIDEQSVWSAVPLKNGNLLTSSNENIVKEMTRSGKILWSFSLSEVPDYTLTNPQIALRLPNGNTLINNWFNQWSSKLDVNHAPVQAIEVQPDKKIVWALRAWTAPNLGPSTSIQLLNTLDDSYEKAYFGEIK